MPTLKGMQFPRPKAWNEFETIVWDLFRKVWNDPNAQKAGCSGQSQDGVDIWGHLQHGSRLAGIQVKLKTSGRSRLAKSELRAEVEKAKRFSPPLSEFIIVTSSLNDARVQEEARRITEEHRAEGLFSVDVWGWEEVERRLTDYPELLEKHYPEFFASWQEASWAEERDRPRFEVINRAVTELEKAFTPQWTLKQVSGDYVPNVQWRFRGQRFTMEWRQASGHELQRNPLSETFDLTVEPKADDLVEIDEIALEIRFHWRGKWRRELHRYPMTRRVLPQKVLWEEGREHLPPLYPDE